MSSTGPRELEYTWLGMLAFLAAAWLLIGGAGAGLTLAFTYSAWAFAWFIPCALFTTAMLAQLARLRKVTHDDARSR
jgi:hypothetical protein